MKRDIMTRIAGIALAFTMALFLAACEPEEDDDSAPSEQTAGQDASGAVGSALDNALENTEDSNDGQLNAQGIITPGAINRALGGVPGFRGAFTGGGATNQASSLGPQTINVDFSGTFDCSDSGTVGVVGTASFTYDWNDGAGADLAHWHQTWAITGLDMTLTDCGEDGYTLNGTADYTTTQTGNFDQSAEDSSLYDFLLQFEEDSSAAIVATHEASGKDYDLDLSWMLDAELTGDLDVLTNEADFQTVDATIVWSANDWTCTGTWTDPDADWEASCTNN